MEYWHEVNISVETSATQHSGILTMTNFMLIVLNIVSLSFNESVWCVTVPIQVDVHDDDYDDEHILYIYSVKYIYIYICRHTTSWILEYWIGRRNRPIVCMKPCEPYIHWIDSCCWSPILSSLSLIYLFVRLHYTLPFESGSLFLPCRPSRRCEPRNTPTGFKVLTDALSLIFSVWRVETPTSPIATLIGKHVCLCVCVCVCFAWWNLPVR